MLQIIRISLNLVLKLQNSSLLFEAYYLRLTARRLRLMTLASPAFFAAIFYFIPMLLPFFSPGKRASASSANLLREVLFFYIFHQCCMRNFERKFNSEKSAFASICWCCKRTGAVQNSRHRLTYFSSMFLKTSLKLSIEIGLMI